MNRNTQIPFRKKKVDDLKINPSSNSKSDQPPNKLMAPYFFKPPNYIELPFDIESRILKSKIETFDGEPCISEENLTVLLNTLLKERKQQLEAEYTNQKSAFCDNYAKCRL